MSSRVAVVDVGTNTTRLLIADVEDGAVRTELTRISRVTRLGAGVDRTGVLAEDALERERAVLADYRAQIAAAGAQRAVAIMTSAVRDARNGAAFAAEVQDDHGLEPHVLSGDQEARLTYLGATDEIARDDPRRLLVFDIGGGSTEIVIGHGTEIDFHVSTQAGVVRQADRHITGDPPSPAELEALALDIRTTLESAVPLDRRSAIGLALAVAGTPTSLAAIAQRLDPYDPSRVHGYTLTLAECQRIFERLLVLPLEQRRQVPGLHPDRAVAILPGIVILSEVMDLFALDSVQVSEHDILRGAALAFATQA